MKQSIKAILAGYGILFFTRILFSVSQAFLLAELLGGSIFEVERNEQIFIYLLETLQFITLVFAGYMTAKIAKKKGILHSIAAGGLYWSISMVMNYFMSLEYNIPPSIVQPEVIFHLLYALAGTGLGGFIRSKTEEKKDSATSPSLEEKIETLGNG